MGSKLADLLVCAQVYVWKRSNPKAPAYLYYADNDPSKADEPRRPVLSVRISSFNKSDLVLILGGTLVSVRCGGGEDLDWRLNELVLIPHSLPYVDVP